MSRFKIRSLPDFWAPVRWRINVQIYLWSQLIQNVQISERDLLHFSRGSSLGWLLFLANEHLLDMGNKTSYRLVLNQWGSRVPFSFVITCSNRCSTLLEAHGPYFKPESLIWKPVVLRGEVYQRKLTKLLCTNFKHRFARGFSRLKWK